MKHAQLLEDARNFLASHCAPESKNLAHGHYFKDVRHLDSLDVYRVLELFAVTDPCLQHAVKKLLVAGGRGHKDIGRDVQDAIDSLTRWRQMRSEDQINPRADTTA